MALRTRADQVVDVIKLVYPNGMKREIKVGNDIAERLAGAYNRLHPQSPTSPHNMIAIINYMSDQGLVEVDRGSGTRGQYESLKLKEEPVIPETPASAPQTLPVPADVVRTAAENKAISETLRALDVRLTTYLAQRNRIEEKINKLIDAWL